MRYIRSGLYNDEIVSETNYIMMSNCRESRQFSLFMCLIFVASAALLMRRHEMWRDEIQTWLLIRDVGSFREILSYLKYELHPFLWYTLVYPLKFITKNPEIMKPLHLLIACTSVYLFCSYAPFSRLNKIFFIFGYFPFFEYGVISRNYSLVLLFSFLLASIYAENKGSSTFSKARLYGLTAGLFLICQTHLWGIVIGSAFSFLIALDVFIKGERKKLIPLFGFLGGVIIFFVQIWPPSNLSAPAFVLDQDIVVRLKVMLLSLWRGFSPLPIPFLHFWNSNILDINKYLFYLQHLLALLVLIGSIAFVLTLKARRYVFFYCVGIILFLSVIYITAYLTIRFYGFIFIIFIVTLWLGYGSRGDVCKSRLISMLLLIHVAATSIAYYYDMKYPFSAAKEAAVFIKSFGCRDFIIVGYKESHVSSLAGYLNSKIYYSQANRFGSFITWDKTSLVVLNTCEIMRQAGGLKNKSKKPVLVVLSYMPKKEELICKSGPPFTLLRWSPPTIVANETYSIWLIQ